jgi:DNA-binding transcriptional MerR regulator
VGTLAVLDETFTIAGGAEKTGVSAGAVRNYERVGRLDVARQRSRDRRCSDHNVERVVLTSRLRAAAMPIRDIQRYFALVARGPATEDATAGLRALTPTDMRGMWP